MEQAVILVAEDDPITRKLIELCLKGEGYAVHLACHGGEARQLLSELRPDLVISDWMMPELDGLGLLQFVRDHEVLGNPYFILLTVRQRSEDKVAGLDTGADDYMIKPFESEELQARVRCGLRILGLRRSLEDTVRQLAEKARILEEDLRAAERAQRDLLPKNMPVLSGVQFFYRFVPCHYVSGDSLNVFRLSEDHIGFYMLDVCGHGVQAVMLSVSIHRILTPDSNLNSPLKRPLPDPPYYRICQPAEVIEILNSETGLTPVTDFFTFFYGVLNHRTRELVYSRAGHLPPLLLHADGSSEFLTEGGMPVGVEEDVHWQQGTRTLQLGDRLVVYSDGVVDVHDAQRKAIGVEGLQSFLEGQRGLDVKKVLENVEEFALEHGNQQPFPDDFSLLGLQVT